MTSDPTASPSPFARTFTLLVALSLFIGGLMSSAPEGVQAARDELRLAGPVESPETLDPAQVRDLSSLVMFRQIFRGLMLYDDHLNPVPEIAESVSPSENGLSYSFALRPDASFQDGSPITAADVAFSLSRAVNPQTTGGDSSLLGGPAFLSGIAGFADVYAGKTDSLSGITIDDDQALTITLTKPDSTFLMKLASVPASVVSRAQVTSESDWWARPIGSGPYSVSKWEPDSALDLKAYEDFFGGKPATGHITFRLGAAALQSFNLYQSGDIDVDSIGLSDINRVADPDGQYIDQLVVTPLFALGYIALNSNIAPLDDPYVRLALQLIFPRQEFARVGFDGWVNAANGAIPGNMLNRTWSTVVPGTSLDAARAALAKSRYGAGADVPAIRIYTAGAFAATVLQSVAEQELGLTIEVFDLDFGDMFTRFASGEVPAYELYWASDYPDPAGILQPLFETGQSDNYLGYSNSDIDELLDQAAAEPDVDIRSDLYQQVNRILCADNIIIPVYNDVDYSVVQPYVHNLVITAMGILRLETVRVAD